MGCVRYARCLPPRELSLQNQNEMNRTGRYEQDALVLLAIYLVRTRSAEEVDPAQPSRFSVSCNTIAFLTQATTAALP